MRVPTGTGKGQLVSVTVLDVTEAETNPISCVWLVTTVLAGITIELLVTKEPTAIALVVLTSTVLPVIVFAVVTVVAALTYSPS